MAAAPCLSEGRAADESLWLRWRATGDDGFEFESGLDGESWGNGDVRMRGAHEWTVLRHSVHLLGEGDRSPSAGNYERELRFRSLISRFENFFLAGSQPFASAPIHAVPRRTYDPTRLADDPWGADVPSRLASLEFRDKTEWTALKEKLDEFGWESGLFDDFSVKQLTKFEGGPFQLQGPEVREEREERTQTEPGRRGIRDQPGASRACGSVSRRRTAHVSSPTARAASPPRAPKPPWEASSAGPRKRGGSSSWKPTATT